MDEEIVLNILLKAGYQAYLVGGCVRSNIAYLPYFDVDICTDADFDTLCELFSKYNIKKFKEYSSIHFKYDIMTYEITTFRKELKYRNNKPIKIELCNSIEEDYVRRDFTINALYAGIDGEVIDPSGDGINDFENKIIRCIGNTHDKLMEDNTRVLRAIRLSFTLGFKLDEEITDFILLNKDVFKTLSKEFIHSELDKIFEGDYVKDFFDFVDEYNLKSYLHLEYDKIVPALGWGIWAQIETDINFCKFDRDAINKIKELVRKKKIDKYDLYYNEFILVLLACMILKKKSALIEFALMPIHNRGDIDINNNDLLEIIDKKYINRCFKDIEKAILDRKIRNKKKSIIRYVKKWYKKQIK